MSPKIHPEIHNIGQPGKPSTTIEVEKHSLRPDPNVMTIRGPVPTTPRHDPDIRVPVPDPSKGENYPSPG